MRRIRPALALAGLWLFVVGTGLAAPQPATDSRFIVDTWQARDGLPQSSVISMIQTHDGYLWLGTLNGLVRFDGVHFTIFDEANTPGLNSSRIVHLFEDSHSNLWVGTETAGVALLQNGRVKNVDIGGGSREGRLMSACDDADGAVWLYTADGHLLRYFNSQVNVWNMEEGSLGRCRVLMQEPGGSMWVGADWGQGAVNTNAWTQPSLPLFDTIIGANQQLDYLLAGKAGGYWRLADGRIQIWRRNHLERDLAAYPWEPETPLTTACEDAAGNLIVGTFGDGIYWFDPQGNYEHITTADGLSHNIILSLCVDREGSLWVGTDGGGLDRVKHNPFQTVPESRNLVTQSVCEDIDGGLWAGFNNGGLMYLKDGSARVYGITNGLLNLYVWSVLADRSGGVWAGTWGLGGLFRFEAGRFHPVAGPVAVQTAVLAIYEDKAGRLWFGTQGGLVGLGEQGWSLLTTSNGLGSDTIRAIVEDQTGNLWVGTMGGGLTLLKGSDCTTFRKEANGLPSDNISSLYVDKEGVLWIGTFGSGLARYHAGKWTHFTTDDGLASNGIGYLLEDGEGNLWIGSNAGLMRIPKAGLNAFAEGRTASFHCRTFTEADGLPTRECTQGSQPGACGTRDGKLWFPTTRGLAGLNPAELRPNTNPPPVLIESVAVDGQTQGRNGLQASPPQSVTIPPQRERLEIEYTSLNLASPERARFRYRMAGHESDWVEADRSRIARYSKLPPGEYRFQVIACNEDGVWNATGASLAVIVQPPFWRTLWFASLMGILLVGTIVTTVYLVSTQKLQRRLRQQEALEKDRSRIARDLHDQLGASLTQVALLGEMVEGDKDQPAEVENHARQISQTARDITHVLDEIVWAVNPQNDTLDSLVTYVCKYAQDYLALADLRYRLDVPSTLPASPLRPEIRHNVFLAAKEAITNVVRHAQAKSVWLRLKLEPGRFTLEIEDDGCGLPDADKPSTRNGLKNMRKRMEEAGGAFAISPTPEHGTIVRLTAPLDQT